MSSILRIGPIGLENVCTLRSAIINHFHPNASADSSSSGAQGSSNKVLTISNRYFDASVLLLGLDEPRRNDTDALEDGVVLAFDADLPLTFDALGDHHEAATRAGRAGDVLRLCVGVATGPSPLADGSKRSEAEYSRRVLWCLDRGYEYVEADVTPEGLSRGHDERDKDGFARVVEAIGTAMWSSHVMKPRDGGSRRRGAAGAAAAPVAAPRERAEGGAASPSPSQPNAAEGTTGDASRRADDAEREKAALATLMQGMEAEADKDTTSDDEQAGPRHEEASFRQLEQVLSEARLLREASAQDSISDEERRKRAGDTAVRLMGLLDGLGEEGDSSDEGSCDGHES